MDAACQGGDGGDVGPPTSEPEGGLLPALENGEGLGAVSKALLGHRAASAPWLDLLVE